MRWIICIAVLSFLISCQTASQSAEPIAPCPNGIELSSRKERNALLLPLAENLSPQKKAQLVELLKLWALDMSEILAALRLLEVRAACEGSRYE
ncbi:MAG: hypothetical protein AAF975_02055 [Spirochaetota bacterium]